MKPIWKKIENENPELKTEYVEYDENQEIIKRYNLEAGHLPTFIFLDSNGNEITRMTGEIEEKTLLEAIEKYKDR